MGIFGSRGTDGLPPLGDDEHDEHEQRRCHTIGCKRKREEGLTTCLPCHHKLFAQMIFEGDATLAAWPNRTPTPARQDQRQDHQDRIEREAPADLDPEAQAEEAELIRTLAAPLFERQAIDRRCRWCCHLLNEFAHPLGCYQPQTDASGKPTFTCASHAHRLRALRDVERKMERMRFVNQQSTAQIAKYFQYGYLGDYLHTNHQSGSGSDNFTG